MAEEGVTDVKREASFGLGLGLGFAAFGWVQGFGNKLGEKSWGFKRKRKHGGMNGEDSDSFFFYQSLFYIFYLDKLFYR